MPTVVAVALILGGIAILVIERLVKDGDRWSASPKCR